MKEKKPMPKEIRVALKHFNKYHDEIFKVGIRSRRDPALRDKLAKWAMSLTGMNCWFGEYDAGKWIGIELLVWNPSREGKK